MLDAERYKRKRKNTRARCFEAVHTATSSSRDDLIKTIASTDAGSGFGEDKASLSTRRCLQKSHLVPQHTRRFWPYQRCPRKLSSTVNDTVGYPSYEKKQNAPATPLETMGHITAESVVLRNWVQGTAECSLSQMRAHHLRYLFHTDAISPHKHASQSPSLQPSVSKKRESAQALHVL